MVNYKKTYCFAMWLAHFEFLPRMYKSLSCSVSLSTLDIIRFYLPCHSKRCIVVFCCSANLNFPHEKQFCMLNCDLFMWNVFSNLLLIFKIVEYWNYIFSTYLMCKFSNVFSQPPTYIFILLTVSFERQSF